MVRSKQPDGYWTKNRCASVAKKCTTRTEFIKKYSSAYTAAHRNNWLEEICSHMLRSGNSTERIIYVFEFSDGNAYIGLTWKPEERYQQHMKNGPVFKHILESRSKYEFKILSDYVDKDIAAQLEDEYIGSYRAKGWKLLNSRRAGGLGGSRINWTKERCAEAVADCETKGEVKERYPGAYAAMQRSKWLNELLGDLPSKISSTTIWTFEACQAEAKKYKYRGDFQKGMAGAYNAALQKGWLDDICGHMPKRKMPNPIKWTKKRCHEEALKHEYRIDFLKGAEPAYRAAHKKGWLDGICVHMTKGRKPKPIKWTKERCREEALKYDTRGDFQKYANTAYAKAHRNKWLDDICSHMHHTKKPAGYWTKERCHEEALKYKTKGDFQENSNTAYTKAHRNKWLDDVCAHMINIRKPNGYWSKEKCHEVSLQFMTKNEFRDSASNVYAAALRGGWIDEICVHMQPHRRPPGYWTKERCISEASKYNTRSEFRKKSGGAAIVADGHEWFDEIWKLTHPEKE